VVLADRKGKAVRGQNDLTWKGGLVGAGPGFGDVVITRRGPWVSGAIFTAAGTFQIEPVPGGGHRLVELDSAAMPGCDGAIPAGDTGGSGDASAPAAASDDGSRVDVLAVFTPQASAAAGGTAAMETVAQNAVDVTNTAYQNSQIGTTMHFAAAVEVAYNDSGSMDTDLDWVRTDAGVAALRDSYAADMVSLITENGGGCTLCGDGIDLGGASCADVNCASGFPTCTGGCTIDYGTCSGCPVCDGDGVCEAGEDCNGCPSDCASGQGAACGNGVCEASNGEDCLSCAADCRGKLKGKPNGRYCCGDGQNPRSCAADCGSPGAELCGDGVDNDCDGQADCDDGDCASEPACQCGAVGTSCTSASDCCSGKCKGKTGKKTCK
jgi:hypothetical protein